MKKIERGSKKIAIHFKWFGLKVNFGNNDKQEPSKTEAILFQKPKNKTDSSQTHDIILNDDGDCFTSTTNFKYLGTMFEDTLKDNLDINERIQMHTQLLPQWRICLRTWN